MVTIAKPLVIVESPFAGDIARNIHFARLCVRDSLMRGEAPFASHLLYTQPGILRDEVHEERELGMGTGWNVTARADLVAIYVDLGWSSGMKRGKEAAVNLGLPMEERQLMPPGQFIEHYERLFHGADFSTAMNFPNV